jgi:hypothetical protein
LSNAALNNAALSKVALNNAALNNAALNNAGRRRLWVVRSLPATTQSVVLREGAGNGSRLLEEAAAESARNPRLAESFPLKNHQPFAICTSCLTRGLFPPHPSLSVRCVR